MKIFLLIASIFFIFASFGLAEAAVTASENFCEAFPTYPECTGWRVESIYDNFWFCAYVDLPTICKNPPDPQKQIPTLDADYCCRLFDDDLVSPRDVSKLYYDPSYLPMMKKGLMLDESYPVKELVIWTDKDHYNFGDRINVYGKFDFSDPIIKKSNLLVNVVFNDEIVIRDLPVRNNGWFAGFFFLDNPRYHTTGLNAIYVSYTHIPNLEHSYRLDTSTYQFTTGNIPEPKNLFSIWLTADTFSIGDHIGYGTKPEIPLPSNLKHNLISRITNPDGIAFPLPTNSMENLDVYMNEISDLRSGNYTISMTVGNFTTHNIFEYKK
jgi:hypothetical protein